MKNKGLLELEEFLLESLIIVFVHCFVHLGEIGALKDCLGAFTACTRQFRLKVRVLQQL